MGRSVPAGGDWVMMGFGQLSLAVTRPVRFDSDARQLSFTSCNCGGAQLVRIGNSVSLTMTLNEQVFVLPQPSSARQVTVVVPTPNSEPEAGVQTRVMFAEQLSVAVVVKLWVAPHTPGVLARVMSAGQVMAGAVVSCTLMSCVQ